MGKADEPQLVRRSPIKKEYLKKLNYSQGSIGELRQD